MQKRWFESKTLWFNFITILICIVQHLGGVIDQKMVVEIVAIGNIVLRLITKESLTK